MTNIISLTPVAKETPWMPVGGMEVRWLKHCWQIRTYDRYTDGFFIENYHKLEDFQLSITEKMSELPESLGSWAESQP